MLLYRLLAQGALRAVDTRTVDRKRGRKKNKRGGDKKKEEATREFGIEGYETCEGDLL